MSRALAPRLSRLARVLLALLLGCVLTEGLLRLAGATYLAVSRRRAEHAGGRAEREGGRAGLLVACLGDSNVFGIFGGADESYPAELERLLTERADPDARVLNLGVPGTSTLHVVRDLEIVIDRWAPDALLVTAGANNAWAWVGDSGEEPEGPPWYAELRLAKLARLLAHDLGAGGPSEPGGVPRMPSEGLSKGSALNETERVRSIRRDLERAQAIAGERSTPLIFVAYAANEQGYAEANRVMRSLARERGVALADPSEAVASLEQRLGKEALFHPDLHPRPPCYALVARVAYNELVARGLVAGERLEHPAEGIAAGSASSVQVSATGPELGEGADTALAISITGGRPGTPFRLVAYGLHRESAAEPPPLLEAVDDPLLRALRGRGLNGRLDPEGHARIPLPAGAFPMAPAELHGAHFFCTVFFEPGAPDERPEPPVGPVRVTVP